MVNSQHTTITTTSKHGTRSRLITFDKYQWLSLKSSGEDCPTQYY